MFDLTVIQKAFFNVGVAALIAVGGQAFVEGGSMKLALLFAAIGVAFVAAGAYRRKSDRSEK